MDILWDSRIQKVLNSVKPGISNALSATAAVPWLRYPRVEITAGCTQQPTENFF